MNGYWYERPGILAGSPSTITLSAASAPHSSVTSSTRPRLHRTSDRCAHRMIAGATTIAPPRSPSHHVIQIRPYSVHDACLASASDVTPISGLIAADGSATSTHHARTRAG